LIPPFGKSDRERERTRVDGQFFLILEIPDLLMTKISGRLGTGIGILPSVKGIGVQNGVVRREERVLIHGRIVKMQAMPNAHHY
jgi:hypothetical protein